MEGNRSGGIAHHSSQDSKLKPQNLNLKPQNSNLKSQTSPRKE